MTDHLLTVNKLVSAFKTEQGWLRAVDEISFAVQRGKTLGIVGESGCGKSVTAMSIIDLLPKPVGQVMAGEVYFKGENLHDSKRLRQIRGEEIGVVFQEPMTALNPVHRISKQMMEGLLRHRKFSRREALPYCIDLLRRVGIPNPEKRIFDFPHQLSGGMRQRVMIAMAVSCSPDLLITDEPTTALDVTVQAQILELFKQLQQEHQMGMIMITHDLGVIAETCDEVVVMYGGRIVERASVRVLFESPRHAYTKGLLASLPSREAEPKSRLETIEGQVASLSDFVYGCRYCQRLGREGSVLQERPPYLELEPNHWVEHCPICVE